MPAVFQILPIPSGSQFTQTIGADDDDDLNDFRVRIIADMNVSGLEETDITLSTGYSLQSFEGQNSVHALTIRPPETAGICTVTIGADAVTEGNAETSRIYGFPQRSLMMMLKDRHCCLLQQIAMGR